MIHKYKSIESDQTFEVEDGVTVFVGMNESGKTSILEALAKSNYFDTDDSQLGEYNLTHDFPRREMKKAKNKEKSPPAITLYYEISDSLLDTINRDFGGVIYKNKKFSTTQNYDGTGTVCGITGTVDKKDFWEIVLSDSECEESLKEKLRQVASSEDFAKVSEIAEDKEAIKCVKRFFEHGTWNDFIGSYVYFYYLKSRIPKFLYYDEYYALPSKISLEDLQNRKLDYAADKTAKALIELAELDVSELTRSGDHESFIAELEATSSQISDELFQYWTTNKNLEILFKIEKIESNINHNNRIVEHVLDIRVKNARKRVSLPLSQRSKGFN